MWIMNGPQGVGSISFVMPLEVCGRHAAHMIMEMKKRGATVLDAKKEAEERYCNEILAASERAAKSSEVMSQNFYANCTPGYYNNEGKVTVGATLNASFHAGTRGATLQFFAMLQDQRDKGTALDDFNIE